MATLDTDVTLADEFYLAEDKILRVVVYDTPARAACVNVLGDDMVYEVKARRGAAALVSKTSGVGGITVSGTFNVDPALNEQRVLIALDSADTEALQALTYWHELRRTDAGRKAVFFQGRLTLRLPVETL